MDAKQTITEGRAILGIEFGSTRIKAVLIDADNKPIAQGSHEWENQLVDGLWTYSIEAIWYGLQDCYANLRANVRELYDVEIEQLAAIGVSAMMHGYMPFNAKGEILVPFRTWRNTNTGQAAAELSELFVYNIPLRWSISHLYQAILNGEKHVGEIDFLTTLAGYIHWRHRQYRRSQIRRFRPDSRPRFAAPHGRRLRLRRRRRLEVGRPLPHRMVHEPGSAQRLLLP